MARPDLRSYEACRRYWEELVAWLTPYEDEYPDFPEELTLNMSLSDESAELARTLLHKWMTPSTTYDEMKTFIATAECKVSKG